MDARYYNGGPDDDWWKREHQRESEPRACQWCHRPAADRLSYARIWWFCSQECKADWMLETEGGKGGNVSIRTNNQ